jgi:hypothetical protein
MKITYEAVARFMRWAVAAAVMFVMALPVVLSFNA